MELFKKLQSKDDQFGGSNSKEKITERISEKLNQAESLLRSKIGTVIISNRDKYQEKLEMFLERKYHLLRDIENNSIEEKNMDEICDSLITEVNDFDRKTEEFLREYYS
jgi:hypothetical protein